MVAEGRSILVTPSRPQTAGWTICARHWQTTRKAHRHNGRWTSFPIQSGRQVAIVRTFSGLAVWASEAEPGDSSTGWRLGDDHTTELACLAAEGTLASRKCLHGAPLRCRICHPCAEFQTYPACDATSLVDRRHPSQPPRQWLCCGSEPPSSRRCPSQTRAYSGGGRREFPHRLAL